jgi:hypothetical protein
VPLDPKREERENKKKTAVSVGTPHCKPKTETSKSRFGVKTGLL